MGFLGAIRRCANLLLPNFYVFNYLIAASYFWQENGRLPRSLGNARATIHDFIFDRMIRNRWSELQKRCVDKEFAKIVAASRHPDLQIAGTVAILPVTDKTNVEDIERWLEPFLGQRLIAKPTHSSGKTVPLLPGISMEAQVELLAYSRRNYFRNRRETQYVDLERKIIIEKDISDGSGNLTEHRFFCVSGEVLYAQTNDDIMEPRKTIWDIAEFIAASDESRPETLAKLVELAGAISRDFDFVRVDLYDTPHGIFFGEYTFTPDAGTSDIPDEDFAVAFLRKVRKAQLGTRRGQAAGQGRALPGQLAPEDAE